uniref:Uncharacterized protein n=1 Tax=Laticauda laticaudata TaxID=8630 RepID=A0A8C5T3I5_LATLA
MAAAIASGLIRQKRQARDLQHWDRPSANRRRNSPSKNRGLCNGNLVDIFSKVRIFGLKKRRLRRQGACVRGLSESSFPVDSCLSEGRKGESRDTATLMSVSQLSKDLNVNHLTLGMLQWSSV